MRTALRFLIPIALAVGAALWLASVEGTVTLEAGAISVETSTALAVLALLALLLLVFLVTRLAGRLALAGARRRARRAIRRRDQGDDAVLGALAALAAGDGAGALRLAGQARRRLGARPIALLLEGHAARTLHDRAAAKRAFEGLSEAGPPAAFLGHRGLAELALEGGDKEAAAAAARAALTMRPEAGWAKALAFDAAAREGQWQAALALVPPAEAGSGDALRRAALLLAAADGQPDQGAALRLVKEAVETAPGLAPAHAAHVTLLEAQGRQRRANRALERGIAAAAHPLLSALALRPRPGEDAEARARRVEALAEAAGGSAEAELMAARAALDAGLWVRARSHAGRARDAGLDDKRVFLLLAELAEAEKAGTEAGRQEAEVRRREAAVAREEPAWWCDACGKRHEAWAPVCAGCGRVASLRWTSGRPPGREPVPVAAPVPGL